MANIRFEQPWRKSRGHLSPSRVATLSVSLTGAMRPLIGVLIALAFWIAPDGHAEMLRELPAAAEKVSICALQADPAKYNHQLLEVRAVVSHGLNDFTLSDPRCQRPSGIWLEYGGRVDSETVYCCGVKTPRTAPLAVEGLETRLVENALFRRFDARVRTQGDVRFRSQLIGRFFAGVKQRTPNGEVWGGYGHFGCCSLLVIERVLAVDANARSG